MSPDWPWKAIRPGTVLFPDVAELAQHVGVVVHAGGWHHAQRVEFGRVVEDGLAGFVLQLGEARDHAAAIAEHADGAAFPVALARPVRRLELAQQIDHVVLVLRQPFQAGNEARPRPGFELIEHRGGMHLLGHGSLLLAGSADFRKKRSIACWFAINMRGAVGGAPEAWLPSLPPLQTFCFDPGQGWHPTGTFLIAAIPLAGYSEATRMEYVFRISAWLWTCGPGKPLNMWRGSRVFVRVSFFLPVSAYVSALGARFPLLARGRRTMGSRRPIGVRRL